MFLAAVQRVEGGREGDRPLVRKAITCSLKEQMESFCASFPPFPLSSAYLNDMSSPNIQLLSWEVPLHSLLSAGLWECGCQKGCVFTFLLVLSICMCMCVSLQMFVWVSNTASFPPCLTIFLSKPLRQEQEKDRQRERKREESEKRCSEKEAEVGETWKKISGA